MSILRNLPNLHGWDEFNLKKAISSALVRDIVPENDANLAASPEREIDMACLTYV
jgi:predicted NBD/HSP70 family sugar kinase